MRTYCTVFALLFLAVSGLQAGVIFSDNFDSGASAQWGNQVGSWAASGGVYDATSPSTTPDARSLLPFNLSDFEVDVDTTQIGDGGVWLRATNAPGTTVGATGVLLVISPDQDDIYWYVVTDGSSYGSPINSASLSPKTHSYRIIVSGNVYSVFVAPQPTARTTLTTSAFSSGLTGLSDFQADGFDNFVLTDDSGVPEPATFGLAALGLGLLALARQRLRKA
jgi:hypothetical protein